MTKFALSNSKDVPSKKNQNKYAKMSFNMMISVKMSSLLLFVNQQLKPMTSDWASVRANAVRSYHPLKVMK